MATSYLDLDGLALYDEKIKLLIATKKDASDTALTDAINKRHTHANSNVLAATTAVYTTEEKNKLENIDGSLLGVTADQIGKVKGVSKNGTPIALVSGVANVTVPTKVSELSNDSNFALKSFVDSELNGLREVALGRAQTQTYATLQAAVSALNALASGKLKAGDNIYILAHGVPDLWVSGVAATATAYGYTTDAAFIAAINASGAVQVGLYKLSKLETEKVVLDGYVQKENGKALSSNDFTDSYKSSVDANTAARHTHSNKNVLDGITSALVNSWNGKQSAMSAITNAQINALFA